MKIKEIAELVGAEIISGQAENTGCDSIEVKQCYSADLMSDVLAFVKPGTLLLTGLTTPQVVYTAESAGISVVCFVRGKKPHGDIVNLAKEKEIVLLATKNSMFEGCGRLYKNGLIGCYDSSKHESFGSQM